jgi:hypothetical protein
VVALAGALGIGSIATGGIVLAQTSSSNNYQMVESQFGNTGTGESCSEEFCARVMIGDDGRASSATSVEFGEANYSEPLLEMIVEGGNSNLGELSTERTGVKLMNIKIRNYLTGGYRLQIVGTPPKFKGHTLKASAEPIEPLPGVEQFGMNAVANTIPEKIGKNPVFQPSGEEALTLLSTDYDTPNVFRYVSGDTIATSQENTGGADFTITMIVNISSTTPAGLYSADFAAIILPYF